MAVAAPAFSAEEIRQQLEKIVASEIFAHSGRMSRFLRFVVEAALQGRAGEIKEYSIGVEVFDRPPSYDPRSEPVVRVEARRLRSKLEAYYQGEGRNDPILIELPKGSYVPLFHQRETAPPRFTHRKAAAIAVAAVVLAGVVYWSARRAQRKGARTAAISSVAVLPFTDMSPQKDQEYFCDGLTEELIQELARVDGLRVAARTSAFQFKGKGVDIRRAGEQLKADAVVEGSVRKEGNKVRITAQLVSVADGYHLWSATYDREFADLFGIQEEISRSIATALRRELAGRSLTTRYSRDPQAYDLYLYGRFYWRKTSPEAVAKARRYFEQAIEKDPRFALAYAGLADSYASSVLLEEREPAGRMENLAKAKMAARKALEIDPALPEAHVPLAVASCRLWEWREAEREFRRAIELDPNYATAHNLYANTYLAPRGELADAFRELKQALELEPLDLATNVNWAKFCSMRGVTTMPSSSSRRPWK